MGNDCRFKIPEECREFGDASFDERLQVAKNLIQEFTRHVAPSKDLDERNEEWTKSVRARFIEICPLDCDPFPKDRCTDKGEFLLDYVWEEKGNGKRILMASESEWGSDRYGCAHWDMVEEDFEKLLVIKAIFKVLIFSSNFKMADYEGEARGDYSIGFAKMRIESSLGNYGHHIPGETYIFVDFPQMKEESSSGIFRSYIWIAKNFGKDEVKLEEGPAGDLVRP